MKKFRVKESTFFFFFLPFFSLFRNFSSQRGGNSSSTRKLNLATIHPVHSFPPPPLSAMDAVPPTTKNFTLKESGILVGTSMIIGVSLCVPSFAMETDRFERKRDLTFGACSSPLRQWNSLVILQSTVSISLILFFFTIYISLRKIWKKKTRTSFSTSSKKVAKNLDNEEQGFSRRRRYIWNLNLIHRSVGDASIWEGRRCAQLSTNHRICCCGFRNTRPSSSSW